MAWIYSPTQDANPHPGAPVDGRSKWVGTKLYESRCNGLTAAETPVFGAARQRLKNSWEKRFQQLQNDGGVKGAETAECHLSFEGVETQSGTHSNPNH